MDGFNEVTVEKPDDGYARLGVAFGEAWGKRKKSDKKRVTGKPVTGSGI